MYFLFHLKTLCYYRLRARKGKHAHSPFVYNLSLAVFDKKTPPPDNPYHFGDDKYGRLLAKIADYIKSEMTIINLPPNPNSAYRYFEETVKYSDNNSIVIVRDIYHSPETAMVWEKIKAHPKTTVTFDLFKMGIVFFRRESSKENFVIKY